VVPSGPVMVTAVGEGAIVTEGGILIGSRPMIDTALHRCAVELNERARCTRGGRMIMARLPTRRGPSWRSGRK